MTMTSPFELEPGVLVHSTSAPKRLMGDIVDGWHGRPFSGKMVKREQGECWVTGAALETLIEPANPERFSAYEFGLSLRTSWQEGHRVKFPDGRVFAVPVHRHSACSCTMCLKR